MDRSDITIIIPAYNEEKGIGNVISQLKKLNGDYQLLVVDDGSTDNTFDILKKSGVGVVHHKCNKGYGAALKTGLRNAQTSVVLFIDADGQHNTDDIERIAEHIDEYDMVVGARTKKSTVSLLRRPGKKILSITANYLSGHHIPDLNSGFRAIKKDKAMEFMHILPNTFSFTTTITLAFLKSGYDVKYVPIQTIDRVGTSKIKPFRDGFRFIMLIVRTIALFDPLKVFLPISIMLFIAGMLYGIYTILTTLNISDTSAILLTAGVLTFLFGLLADQISLIRLGNR